MENNTDYSSMISGLLGDPETMGNVMRIAQKLMGEQGDGRSSSASSHDTGKEQYKDHSEKEQYDNHQSKKYEEHSDIIATDGSSSKNKNIFESFTGQLSDKESAKNRERLLVALKPYLSSERQNILDTILKLMKLMQFADIGKLFEIIK